MALTKRLGRLLGGDDADDGDDAPYRCIKCGAGFEKPHRECPRCGGAFVAAADDGE